MILCLAAAILIVFFVTLGYDLSSIPELTGMAVYQTIFFLLMEPYFSVSVGLWSVLAALAVGAFIGGLASKGAKHGALVGLISWIIIFILYLAVAFVFDFAALATWWGMLGINIVFDIAIGLGVLVVVGAIGGAITGGGEK
jgi:hypothetical protein